MEKRLAAETKACLFNLCVFYLIVHKLVLIFFFFQAEDGIRDTSVTGVQTCALPIFFHNISRRGSGLAASRESSSNVVIACPPQDQNVASFLLLSTSPPGMRLSRSR